MTWLKQHLDDFVYPVIGKRELTSLQYFLPGEMSIIKNAWRSFKRQARGKTILLPGRDVYVFEILARRENYPTLFMPEISRKTVRYYRGKLPIHDVCILDTGFAGSIPLGLNITSFKMLSHYQHHSDIHIFPRLKMSRQLALKIEDTPKYWKTAYVDGGEVRQDLATLLEFEAAARLTVAVYTNSAPRFTSVERCQDVR